MPNYDYTCMEHGDFEKNVPVDQRDEVFCEICGNRAGRNLTFKGVVWAPTSTGGGMK